MASNNRNAAAGRANSVVAPPDISTLLNPVFLDEVNFPIQKVITTINGPIDKAYNRVTLDLSGARISSGSNLFDLKTFGPSNTTIATIHKPMSSICHNTVDMRDSFRMFVDLSDPSKKYAIACLTGKDADLATCKANIKTIFNTDLGLNVEHVFTYKYLSSYDKFGNTVVSPPSSHDPFGTIILGSQTTDCIEIIKGGNSNALKFSWRPSCTEIASNSPLNNSQRREREEYCRETYTFDFSTLDPKGKNPDVGISGETGISGAFSDILSHFKQRKIEIFTGWLEVGHSDEIISFIPYPRTESTHGFKILIASPAKFLELWETAYADEGRRSDCLFTKLFLSDDYEARNYILQARTQNAKYKVGIQKQSPDCDILIGDFSNEMTRSLRELNAWIQTTILDKIKEQLISELAVTMDDFIDIPLLYIGPDELFSYLSSTAADWGFQKNPQKPLNMFVSFVKIANNNFGLYHISNNFINSLYSSKYIVSPTFDDNIGCEEYIRGEVIRPGCIEHIYDVVDEWTTVKWQHGGLHCYTTESRDTSTISSKIPFPRPAAGGRRKKIRKTRKMTKKRTNKSRRNRK